MFAYFMLMTMTLAISCVSMNMCVNMGMLMSMNYIPMAMFVNMRMLMFMGMLQFNRIFYHKPSADYHNNQGYIKPNS